jgi:hypothetical protein
MVGVLATTAFRQSPTSQFGQSECIVEFTIREQSCVGGDAAAVEL